jgi:hypothetical protein
MFFYSAFMASGGVGGLIAITRLIASLNNAPGAEAPIEIAKGIAIDFGAVIIFALLYRSLDLPSQNLCHMLLFYHGPCRRNYDSIVLNTISCRPGFQLNFAVTDAAHAYRWDSKARDKALAKIGREENLSNLRLELSNKKVVTIGQLRGTSRIVILAGPASYIEEALRQSEPFKKDLLERGVLVAAYATDGATIGNDSPAPLPSSTPPSTISARPSSSS